MIYSPAMPHSRRNRPSRADKPYEGMTTVNAYFTTGFEQSECIRAEVEVRAILRDIGETRLEAQAVLLAMLPAMEGKTINVSKKRVRAAVEKIMQSE